MVKSICCVGVADVNIAPVPSSYNISASLTLMVSPIEYPVPALDTTASVTAPLKTTKSIEAPFPPEPVAT